MAKCTFITDKYSMVIIKLSIEYLEKIDINRTTTIILYADYKLSIDQNYNFHDNTVK